MTQERIKVIAVPASALTEIRLVDRAYVARLLGITTRQVKRNEVKLGILPAKVFLNSFTVRYHLPKLLAILEIAAPVLAGTAKRVVFPSTPPL